MKGFAIYREYFDLITLLPSKDQGELLLAICNYMFFDEEPDISDSQMKIFVNLKRPLDKSKNQSKIANQRWNNNANNNANDNANNNANDNANNNANDNANDNAKRYAHQDVIVNVNDNVNVNYKNNDELEKNDDEIVNFLEENFGRTISPIEYQKFKGWLEDFDERMVRAAIKLAVENNKKSFSYVNGILNNWKIEGRKIDFSKQPTEPDWFEKEIERQPLTQEEKNEVDKLLENFD